MPMMDHDERRSGAFRPRPLAPQSSSVAGAWAAIAGLLASLCLVGVVCAGDSPEGDDAPGGQPVEDVGRATAP